MGRLTTACCITYILFALCGDLEAHSLEGATLEKLLKKAGTSRNRRLTDGTVSNGCDYPGIVDLSFNGLSLCNAVYINGYVMLTDDYGQFLDLVLSINLDITVQGGDGTSSGTIAAGSTGVNNNDGTWTYTLTTDLSGSWCSDFDATIYDSSMSIDSSNCSIVSLGTAATKYGKYTGVELVTPLISDDTLGLCSMIKTNIVTASSQLGTPDLNHPGYYTCAKSAAGICSGDISAGIFCMDSNDVPILVGLVASGTCTPNEIFLAVDLTANQLTGFSYQ